MNDPIDFEDVDLYDIKEGWPRLWATLEWDKRFALLSYHERVAVASFILGLCPTCRNDDTDCRCDPAYDI